MLRNNFPELIFLTFFTLMISFNTASAQAQPGVPHQFFGSVTINGVPAPDNVLVTAEISGVGEVAGTITSDGKYGYSPYIFYVPDPHGNRNGKTIEFYVGGVKGGEAIFKNGQSTKLDLSVTIPNFCGDGKCESGESCSSCSKDCGTCTQTGGGNGGGPSGGIITGGGETCEEKWICTDWFECFNGNQVRVCVDENNCETTEDKPPESQACEEEEEEGVTPFINIQLLCGNGVCDDDESCETCSQDCGECFSPQGGTGMFIGLQGVGIIGGLVALIVVLALFFYLRR